MFLFKVELDFHLNHKLRVLNLKMTSKIDYVMKVFCVSLIAVLHIKAEETVNIIIKPKQFNGLVKEIEGKNVNIFLGIPYAKPPVGDLRFKKPLAFDQNEEPVNALKWPNPCQQSKLLLNMMPLINNTNFSEDCLYLNIWSPVDSPDAKQELKPVLFWIHGGGYYFGSSNWDQTDGEVLAAKGDVVVVTFNYRLGQFGFLYTGSDDAPGNVGLWDQALALKWVNEHIIHFGGNPNQITVFGDSAGSWSVSLHLLSPITRNLFKNAIMMSGGALTDFYMDTIDAKKMWSNIAADFSCEDDFKNGSALCLRNVKSENLIESAFDKRYKTDINIIKPFVIYGDEFLPRKPSEMLRIGDFKKNVNLLIGTTEDEGSYLLTSSIDPIKYSLKSPSNLTKAEAKQELKNIFSRFFPETKINFEEVFKLYISNLAENNYDLIRRSIGIVLGDYIRTCPTILFAKQLFSGDRINSKVYQYLWSAKYHNSWHGADHGSDVGFFFGSPFRSPNKDNSNERRISLRALQTVAYFAKYG